MAAGLDKGYALGTEQRLAKQRESRLMEATEFNQDFQTKQMLLQRVRDFSKNLSELRARANNEQRMQAVSRTAEIATGAFMEEATRLGLDREVEGLIQAAMQTPTIIEAASMTGEAQAAQINSAADNLSLERQRAAGLATIPKDVTSGDLEPLNVKDIEELISSPDLAPEVEAEMSNRGFTPEQVEAAKRNIAIMQGQQDRGTAFSNLEEAVGFDSATQNFVNQLPLVNLVFGNKDVAASRNFLETFNEDAKRALIKNPRFPVAEQQKIAKLLPSTGFSSVDEFEFEKLLNLKDFMEDSLVEQNRILADPDTEKKNHRDAQARKNALEEILSKLGDPAGFALSQIPEEAKEFLTQNPDLAKDFDAKYGQGLAGKVLGQ